MGVSFCRGDVNYADSVQKKHRKNIGETISLKIGGKIGGKIGEKIDGKSVKKNL